MPINLSLMRPDRGHHMAASGRIGVPLAPRSSGRNFAISGTSTQPRRKRLPWRLQATASKRQLRRRQPAGVLHEVFRTFFGSRGLPVSDWHVIRESWRLQGARGQTFGSQECLSSSGPRCKTSERHPSSRLKCVRARGHQYGGQAPWKGYSVFQ